MGKDTSNYFKINYEIPSFLHVPTLNDDNKAQLYLTSYHILWQSSLMYNFFLAQPMKT